MALLRCAHGSALAVGIHEAIQERALPRREGALLSDLHSKFSSSRAALRPPGRIRHAVRQDSPHDVFQDMDRRRQLPGVVDAYEPLKNSGGQRRHGTLQAFFKILVLLPSPGQQTLPQYGGLHLHQHGKKIRVAPQGFRQVSP